MNMAQNIVAGLDRILTMELVRVTERIRSSAAHLGVSAWLAGSSVAKAPDLGAKGAECRPLTSHQG